MDGWYGFACAYSHILACFEIFGVPIKHGRGRHVLMMLYGVVALFTTVFGLIASQGDADMTKVYLVSGLFGLVWFGFGLLGFVRYSKMCRNAVHIDLERGTWTSSINPKWYGVMVGLESSIDGGDKLIVNVQNIGNSEKQDFHANALPVDGKENVYQPFEYWYTGDVPFFRRVMTFLVCIAALILPVGGWMYTILGDESYVAAGCMTTVLFGGCSLLAWEADSFMLKLAKWACIIMAFVGLVMMIVG